MLYVHLISAGKKAPKIVVTQELTREVCMCCNDVCSVCHLAEYVDVSIYNNIPSMKYLSICVFIFYLFIYLCCSRQQDLEEKTVLQLKSLLTAHDIEFPQKAKPKSYYVDLAFEKLVHNKD